MAARVDRRRLLAGLAAAPLASPAMAEPDPRLLLVSRRRIFEETEAGQALSEAEAAASATFQTRVEDAKRALEARESELARLRGTLSRAEFRRQTEAFDQAVRSTRRETQRQAAVMQKAFRAARGRLAAALEPVLAALLDDHGADAVLDAGQVLAARPGADVTDAAIARFDAEVAPVEIGLGDLPPLLPEDFTPAGAAPEGTVDGG